MQHTGRRLVVVVLTLLPLSQITGAGCQSTGGTPSGAPGRGSPASAPSTRPASGDAQTTGDEQTQQEAPEGCWIGSGRLIGKYLRIRNVDGTFKGDQTQGTCGEGYFTDNLELLPTSDPDVYTGTWAVYNALTCSEMDRPAISATLTLDGQAMTIESTESPYNLLGVSAFARVDCSDLP